MVYARKGRQLRSLIAEMKRFEMEIQEDVYRQAFNHIAPLQRYCSAIAALSQPVDVAKTRLVGSEAASSGWGGFLAFRQVGTA